MAVYYCRNTFFIFIYFFVNLFLNYIIFLLLIVACVIIVYINTLTSRSKKQNRQYTNTFTPFFPLHTYPLFPMTSNKFFISFFIYLFITFVSDIAKRKRDIKSKINLTHKHIANKYYRLVIW